MAAHLTRRLLKTFTPLLTRVSYYLLKEISNGFYFKNKNIGCFIVMILKLFETVLSYVSYKGEN